MSRDKAKELLVHLEKLCDPDSSRDVTSHPFSLSREDGTWTFATDGCILCMVRGDLGYPRYEGDIIQGVLVHPLETFPATRVSLAQFVGEPVWTAPCSCNHGLVTCDNCQDGREECDEGKVVCEICDGDGDLPPKARPGKIGQYVFDRNLLARSLPFLPEQIRVGVWNDKIAIVGDDCFVVLMMTTATSEEEWEPRRG